MFRRLIPFLFAFTLLTSLGFSYQYVFDEAGLLSPDVAGTLDQIIDSWTQKTTHQMAIVTVKSLGDSSIEEYAVKRFQAIGIGSKSKNDGLMLLVAPNERKIRIEVGYGLEGVLPDGLVGSIRDQYIIPFFKTGDFAKGILAGTIALLKTDAQKENIDWSFEGSMPQSMTSHTAAASSSSDAAAGLVFFIIVFIVIIMSSRGRGMSGWLPWIILSALLGSGRDRHDGFGGFGGGFGGFGGGGFGGGMSGGGGASGSW